MVRVEGFEMGLGSNRTEEQLSWRSQECIGLEVLRARLGWDRHAEDLSRL